ncbi:IS110 family transposase [Desulfosediminicola ganghwensis]|uniref:IS110 family transposase n=1 Tax=Desulfosediminicola ganghwensis TaxID=2569540 RepID=UPI001E2EAB4A|nr:IS110 family transposase [Desulfosediminicola ganghwensis]
MGMKVAHPEMLKAITAAKKKNDRDDAEKITDLLRVKLLSECYMLPTEIRELRRVLRYCTHVVQTAVRMQNKMSGLLMEVGAGYNKKRLHGKKYFHNLLETFDDIPESVKELLKLSRAGYEMFHTAQKHLTKALRTNPLIQERVRRLMTIQGVGEVTALTWVLEIGDPMRFPSVRKAVSYCGLCSAQCESAGKEKRGPISKKRNKHLQTTLVEAAKIAPRWNTQLAAIHERELKKGNRNRATLAVARKIVAYMMAVDKTKADFLVPEEHALA